MLGIGCPDRHALPRITRRNAPTVKAAPLRPDRPQPELPHQPRDAAAADRNSLEAVPFLPAAESRMSISSFSGVEELVPDGSGNLSFRTDYPQIETKLRGARCRHGRNPAEARAGARRGTPLPREFYPGGRRTDARRGRTSSACRSRRLVRSGSSCDQSYPSALVNSRVMGWTPPDGICVPR
jgi:hypothetical protein